MLRKVAQSWGVNVAFLPLKLGLFSEKFGYLTGHSVHRAFAAATVHDMFNWLSVIVLSIVELSTGFLEYVTEAIVDQFDFDNENSTEVLRKSGGHGPDLLKPLTKPFTDLVVQVDKKVLLGWSFQVLCQPILARPLLNKKEWSIWDGLSGYCC